MSGYFERLYRDGFSPDPETKPTQRVRAWLHLFLWACAIGLPIGTLMYRAFGNFLG